jgi:hypothetical protein
VQPEPAKPSEKPPPNEKAAGKEKDSQKVFKDFSLPSWVFRHANPDQAFAVLNAALQDVGGFSGFVGRPEGKLPMITWKADPATTKRIQAILEALDVPQAVAEQKSPEAPGRPLEAAGEPPARLRTDLDLVNLAAAYIDAVRNVEITQAKIAGSDPKKSPNWELERRLAEIDAKAASRKLAVLRTIVEVAIDDAAHEVGIAQQGIKSGKAAPTSVPAAMNRVRILRAILESAR